MNLVFLSLTVLCTSVNLINAFRVGSFVVILGLVNKPEYNENVGIVQKLYETADRHRVLIADSECIRSYASGKDINECIKSVSVKDINLFNVQWKLPERLSISEILSNFKNSAKVSYETEHEVTEEELEYITKLLEMIDTLEDFQSQGLFKLPPMIERFLNNFRPYIERTIRDDEREILDRYVTLIRELCQDDPLKLLKRGNRKKLRLIGAWINQNHDFHAMVYVSNAFAPLTETIEQLWDNIGAWKKKKISRFSF